MRAPILIVMLALLACAPREPQPRSEEAAPNAAGLVRLPCASAALRAASRFYCQGEGRNWVTPLAQDVMRDAAARLAAEYPGSYITYRDASWPKGERPFPPHLSHGDGRQIDVALFWETRDGRPLARPPASKPRHAVEPRPASAPDPCPGIDRPGDNSDPPASRAWRLDQERTRALIRILLDDRRVRRLLLEPHLKSRLGFTRESRIRFPGCNTFRHDGHVHVDVIR
jgi:hypothetical protein